MNTPKTCEEYVVNRIMELEKKVEDLQKTIEQQDAVIECGIDFANAIRRNAKLKKLDGGMSMISLDNIYEKYDLDDYITVADYLDLEPEEEKVVEE